MADLLLQELRGWVETDEMSDDARRTLYLMRKAADRIEWAELGNAAKDVMMQCFVKGPMWDGNVSSKTGRGELVERGLAEHAFGWCWLTHAGVRMAVEAPVKGWSDQRWHRKQRGD